MVPVFTRVPPDAASYQLRVGLPLAPSVADPELQRVSLVVVGAVGRFIVMMLEVAGEPVTQPRFDVNMQVTSSPSARVDEV